jgi:hypothetical protein
MRNTVELQITAEPIEFPMEKRSSFKIGFRLKNVSDGPIDPKIHETALLVNGEHSFAWDLAVQNGPRENAWWQLEPGQALSAFWPLGESMFARPGIYDATLRLGAMESSIRIRVL